MDERYLKFTNDRLLKELMSNGLTYDTLLLIKNELVARYHSGYTDGYTDGYHDACMKEDY